MEYIKQWKEGIRMKENGKMYTRNSVALWTAARMQAHARAHTRTHAHTHKTLRQTAEVRSLPKLGNESYDKLLTYNRPTLNSQTTVPCQFIQIATTEKLNEGILNE